MKVSLKNEAALVTLASLVGSILACKPSQTTQAVLPTGSPRPSFVYAVTPHESTTISNSLFRQQDWCKDSIEYALSCASAVCVEFRVYPDLWEPGDDFTYMPNLDSHVALSVDGVTLPQTRVGGSLLLVYGQQWGPFYDACWAVKLRAGVHEATFRFRRTSGSTAEYKWYFAITR